MHCIHFIREQLTCLGSHSKSAAIRIYYFLIWSSESELTRLNWYRSLILEFIASRSIRKVISVVYAIQSMGFWNSLLRRPSSKSWREKGMTSRPTRTSCNQHSNIPQSVFLPNSLASMVVQRVKNLPAMKETQFLSLGQESTQKKGMATHSSILD